MNEIEVSVENYRKAFKKLLEGIKQARNELDRDGVIQRFEFTFELLWKTLKLILDFEGFSCNSPRSCIKEAFRREFIKNGEIYLDMLEDRNLSSHVYDEDTSKDIFTRIKEEYVQKLSEAGAVFDDYVEQGL